MEAFQKATHRRHFGQLITQCSPQHRVVVKQAKVFRTLTAKGLKQQDGLNELSLVVAALRDLKLAELETRNSGKPIVEAEFDVEDVATCFEYYGGLATKMWPSSTSLRICR